MTNAWVALAGWAKAAVIASVSSALGALGGGYVSYIYAVEQARAQRFETSMLTEFQAVSASKKGLYASIDQLTAGLANGKKPDSKLIEAMNSQLLDLHQRVDLFNIGLNAEGRARISSVKEALAAIKVEISQAKNAEDLPYIAGRVAQFEAAYKAVEPIVEKQIGMPDAMLNG